MRVVIVHTLEQAKSALEAAVETEALIILQSAPDAIFYAGSLYLLHMFKQACAAHPTAKAICILDCGDTLAETIAAMRMGHKHIRLSSPDDVHAKLQDIAAAYGVEVHTEPYQELDLLPVRDVKTTCAAWLKEIEIVRKTG